MESLTDSDVAAGCLGLAEAWVRAAIEAERNHCAEAAREYVYQNFDSTREQWQGVADAIRARGSQGGAPSAD